MEIRLQGSATIEGITHRNKLRLSIVTRAILTRISINLLIGIALLLWGFFLEPSKEFIRTLGILSVFYFFQQLLRLRNMRKNLAESVDRYIQRLGSFAFEIHITEHYISYKDEEFEEKARWRKFSNFYVYRDYIFIMVEHDLFSSIAINKNDLTDQNYQGLISFLKTRLVNSL